MSLTPSCDFYNSIAKEKTMTDAALAKLEAEVYGGKEPTVTMVLRLIEQVRRARAVHTHGAVA